MSANGLILNAQARNLEWIDQEIRNIGENLLKRHASRRGSLIIKDTELEATLSKPAHLSKQTRLKTSR